VAEDAVESTFWSTKRKRVLRLWTRLPVCVSRSKLFVVKWAALLNGFTDVECLTKDKMSWKHAVNWADKSLG
jgi:hypothetical protein